MIEVGIFFIFNLLLKYTIVWIVIGMILEILFRRVENIDVKLYFAWYDLWLGWYFNKKSKFLYFGFFPMLGISIHKHKWVATQGFPIDIFCYWCKEKRQGVLVW